MKKLINKLDNYLSKISAGPAYSFEVKFDDNNMIELWVHYFYNPLNKTKFISDMRFVPVSQAQSLKKFAQIAYMLVHEVTIHEMNEQFTINGKRVMNPHFTGYTKLS